MDISTLINQLKAQADAHNSLVLDTSILSQDQVKQLQDEVGLTAGYVTINNISSGDIPGANGNSVTITAGNVDLLNQTGLAVKELTFTASGQVDVLLALTMAGSWKWTDSAPKLTPFPFSKLTPSSTYFIYTTQAQDNYPMWSAQNGDAIKLAVGLNFASVVSISGLSAINKILGNQAPGTGIKMYGPWSYSGSYAYPVMQLTGSLIQSFDLLSGLSLTDLQLAVDIAAPVNAIQEIDTGIRAITSDLQFNLLLNESMSFLVVSGSPLPSYNASLSNLAQSTLGKAVLPAGTDFSTFLPSPLSSAFDSIVFNGFNMVININGDKSVSRVAFAIGERPNASVNLGLFTLSQFTLRAAWMNPAKAGATATVEVTAQANIPVHAFPDPFDFSISLKRDTNWSIDTVEATYSGCISLSDIISEIGQGKVVPDALADLSFHDFVVKSDARGDTFTCSCKGTFDIPVMSQTFGGGFYLQFTKNATTTTFALTGGFGINDAAFEIDVELSSSSGSTNIVFTGSADNISISDLVSRLFADAGIDMSALPNILLSDLKISYNTPTDGQLSIDATFNFDETYTGEFHLVAQKTSTWQFLAYAGISMQTPIDIGSHLPLVGGELTGKFILKESYLVISSKTPTGLTIATHPNLTFDPGVSFGFDLLLAGDEQKITLPVMKYDNGSGNWYAAAVMNVDSSGGGKSSVYTITIQKQVGPIFIDSLALNYANQVISCALTASMAIGPLSASMDGLSFGTSIADFHPVFNLDGLGFAYTTPALTIEGAIIRLPDSQLASDVSLEFDGALIVQAEEFGLSALASYAQLKSGGVSFFIFVDVNIPLGGPPFFLVTGLMGGFGFNRTLVLPGFDQVQDFPLLAIGGPQTGSAKDIAMQTLQILEGEQAGANGTTVQWITPKPGDYWIAAGLKFSSFEIINGELLLVAEFGNDLQFAVLGLAWLSLPQGAGASDTFVFVELQMEAVLKPIDGYFSVAASLTSNSFVLTKDCHLTGGFAFDLWFGKNPYAGQFVMTVGGYHPAFKPPSYYPQVARLGFNWQVSGDVSIKGASYFAVTPSCGMAGGALQALYQSGDVKAWFNAEANFLVTWHPFSFVAGLRIELGASVRVNLLVCHKTVTVSIGASLDLWGPPLGGKVRVHVVVVTITIHFGSSDAEDKNRQALNWSDFKQLMPKPEDVCKIVADKGLTQELLKDSVTQQIIYNNQAPSNPTTKVWIVRAGSFQFNTQSVIPASSVTYGTTSNYGKNADGAAIDIRPMNLTNVTSVHNLQISKDSAGDTPIDVSSWTFTPNHGNVAATLWGAPLKDGDGNFIQGPLTPSADTIDHQLNGYTVQAPDPIVGTTFGVVPISALLEEYILPGIPQNPLNINKPTSGAYLPAASSSTITDIGGIATSLSANRNALFAVLSSNNIYSGNNDPMTGMAANAGNLFTDIPMEQS